MPEGRRMELAELPVTYRTTVGTGHLDDFGHVNVMWYTHFFDEGTWGLFGRLGCGRDDPLRPGHGMFALEQHVRYLAELRQGEAIELRARLLGRSPKRIHFILFLTTEGTAKLSATGEFVGAHVDLEARRSVPFPPSVVAAIDAMLERHGRLAWSAPVCGTMRA